MHDARTPRCTALEDGNRVSCHWRNGDYFSMINSTRMSGVDVTVDVNGTLIRLGHDM